MVMMVSKFGTFSDDSFFSDRPILDIQQPFDRGTLRVVNGRAVEGCGFAPRADPRRAPWCTIAMR